MSTTVHGNIDVLTGIISGDGSGLFNVPGDSISGSVDNANNTTYFGGNLPSYYLDSTNHTNINITLGTETTGNFVRSITGTGAITVTGSGSENADVEISISGSGLDADTLDGLDSTQFLRSDVADVMEADITFEGAVIVGTDTPGVVGSVTHRRSDGSLILSGSTTALLGGNVVLYGQTHANGGDISFRNATTELLLWDNSGDTWEFRKDVDFDIAPTVTGTGIVLDTRTISPGNGLSGGGDLSADRTFTVDGTIARVSNVSQDIVANSFAGDGSLLTNIPLGTATTGDYVASVSGTTNQITVTGSGGEGSTPTLSLPTIMNVPGDLNVTGNLVVSGDVTQIDTTNLTLSDPVLTLNSGQVTPLNDIGLLFQRYDTANSVNYNVAMYWDEATDVIRFATTDEDGLDNIITPISTAMTIELSSGDVSIGGVLSGDGSGLTSVDSTTLDTLDSTQFVRSDALDTVTANTIWGDTHRIGVGTDGDLSFYHTGTNSFVDNNTGALYFRNLVNGTNIFVQGRDAGGTTRTRIAIDGDGDTDLRDNTGTNRITITTTDVTMFQDLTLDDGFLYLNSTAGYRGRVSQGDTHFSISNIDSIGNIEFRFGGTGTGDTVASIDSAGLFEAAAVDLTGEMASGTLDVSGGAVFGGLITETRSTANFYKFYRTDGNASLMSGLVFRHFGGTNDYVGIYEVDNVGTVGSQFARFEPGGTSAPSVDTVITREKGDARFAPIASDKSLKHDITSMENVDEIFAAMRPVNYFWNNDDPDDQRSSERQYGLIAQEVKSVFPSGAIGKDGRMGIDPLNMISLLVKKVQTLEARLATLEGSPSLNSSKEN